MSTLFWINTGRDRSHGKGRTLRSGIAFIKKKKIPWVLSDRENVAADEA